jgi:hypothetical protein
MNLDHAGKHGNRDRFETEKDCGSEAFLAVQDGGKFEIRDIATVGRAPDCHIVIKDHSVSRQHARIFYEAGHYWIKDLDSANGTVLNGKKTGFQMLSNNDEISFGQVKAIFTTTGSAAGPAPLGRDPLEGTDPAFQDGTPTGGFGTAADAAGVPESSKTDSVWDPSRRHPAAKRGDKETFFDNQSLAPPGQIPGRRTGENEQYRNRSIPGRFNSGFLR